MARRRIRWPAIVAAILLSAGFVLLMLNPEVLAPSATRLINRQLQARMDGDLRVGEYHVRPFAGLDAIDVTLTIRGDRGGLTLVSVDTLQLDFRLREVLGRTIRVRRLSAKGIEFYHSANERDPATPQPTMTWPPPIPRLEIDLADIRDAHIEVSNSDGRLLERITRVNWRGKIHGDGEVLRVASQGGFIDWDTRSTVLERPYGLISVDSEGLHVENLGALWNEGRVTASGVYGPAGLDLDASGRNLSTQEVSDLIGIPLDFAAAGDCDIHVGVVEDTVSLNMDFTGLLEEWELERAHGEAVIVDDVGWFPVVRGDCLDTHFDGTLRVDKKTIILEGDVFNANIERGLIPGGEELPKTAGDGYFRLVHTLADTSTHVVGWLQDGEVEIMPFDSCRVDVWATGDSLSFRELELDYGTVHARLAGSSDRNQIFDGFMTLTVADLNDLPPAWEWPVIEGGAVGQMSLHGPLEDLGLAGSLSYQGLAVGPVDGGNGEASLVVDNVLGEDWDLGVTTLGRGFGIGGVAMGEYLAWARVDPSAVVIDSFRTALGDTISTLRGRADLLGDRASVDIERLRVDFAGTSWANEGSISATVGEGLLSVPQTRLVSDQGELDAVVQYDVADSLLAGRLHMENFDLNLIDPFLKNRVRSGGHISAVVDVAGSPGQPEITLQGVLTDAAYTISHVDTLALTASLLGGTVTIDSMRLRGPYGLVEAAGSVSHPAANPAEFWPGAALDLEVVITDGDWAFLEQFEIPALDRLTGRVDGGLHLTGTTDDPLVVGDLDSAPFNIQWLHMDRLTGNLRANRDQLTLGNLDGHKGAFSLNGRLEIPLTFDLMSEPVSPEDGPFYAYLNIPPDTDLEPLSRATNGFLKTSGRGQAEVIISGPLLHPRYQGTLAIDDGGFVIRDTEEIYHGCRMRGTFTDDLLIIQEMKGQEGLRGTFDGAGNVTFEGLVLKSWDITFQADRFLLASIPDLRAVVRTSNGRLTSVPVGADGVLVPKFSGEFEVQKGRYTGSFAADPGGVDPTLGNIAPDWFADVRVIGPPRSARIINRNMELDISGDVNLLRDVDGLAINGGMVIDAGRLPVFNNSLRVVRGRLDFSREVGVTPNVDIDAETRVRLRSPNTTTSTLERITVHASGPADAMEITYSSESGYPREAIERMLLGLSPYPDERGDQSALANASIGAGLNLLEREIAHEVEIFDTIEIDQIQRQEAGNTSLDPLIGVGKYVGTDLYIKYAQGLNQNDRDILIEYQITNHLLLQTEIRRRIDEYQGDATYNLDIKYRFEY